MLWRRGDKTPKLVNQTNGETKPRIIAYALPSESWGREKPRTLDRGDFDLRILPLGSSEPFTECECVVMFAGCFEVLIEEQGQAYLMPRTDSDVDRRHRELSTLLRQNIPAVFLIPAIIAELRTARRTQDGDLFARMLPQWGVWKESIPHGKTSHHEALVPEFIDFTERYCVADSVLLSRSTDPITTIIAGTEEIPIAREVQRKLFLLPCYNPKTRTQAIEIATAAASAVLAYRARLSKQTPSWIADFHFAKEKPLRTKITVQQEVLLALEAELQQYKDRKGALCCQSESLVKIVTELLKNVFGLRITAQEQKIEDANVVDEQGNRLAVIEIKGITGNFKREHINQVDSHRERLDAKDLPGILILNTKIKAADLASKNESVHKDIIQKACSDNILLIRTLDLLRFADLIDQGKKTQDDFRKIILNESGWLRVEGDDVCVRTE